MVKGLETQGITTGEFSIFSFCLLYIICRAKEARNLEMLMGRHRGKKGPTFVFMCVYVCERDIWPLKMFLLLFVHLLFHQSLPYIHPTHMTDLPY